MAKPAKVERDYRQELTDKIIEQMENGTAPWLKPWDPSMAERRLPYNPTTDSMYKGANSIALTIEGRGDPRWMTYKQAAEKGWQVRKGEKGTLIEYWKFSEKEKVLDENGKPVRNAQGEEITRDVKLQQPRVFRAVVFNAEQIDGVPELKREKLGYQWEPIERAEKILQASGAKIIHDQSNRAFYSSMIDEIHMPGKQQFPSQAAYYSTALHELGHWTGHESRLNRQLGNSFGSPEYAKEELRAELSSYFTAERLGIPHEPGQHAAYVKSWVQALKDDKNEIFKASRDAEKITEYVIGLDQTKEQNISKGIELGLSSASLKSVEISQGISMGGVMSQAKEFDFKAELTNKVLSNLGRGLPWEKISYLYGLNSDFYSANPNSHRLAPYNPITNESYTGVTALTLAMNVNPVSEDLGGLPNHVRTDQRWLKAEDVVRLGLKVRPNEMGTVVEVETGTKEVIKNTYFNAQQLDGISRTPENYQFPARLGINSTQNLRLIDIQNNLEKKGVSTKFSAFHEPELFVRELVRRVGNEIGLVSSTTPVSPKDIAKNELRTEIARYLVSDRVGIKFNPSSPYSAAFQKYMDGAHELLGSDKNEIIKAISDAEKISAHVLSLSPERNLKPENYLAMGGRAVYLNVDFNDKAEVKSLGALWDSAEKKWYIPYSEREVFSKFMPKPEPTPEQKLTVIPVSREEKKVILAVPFKEKEEAKALGAKWDKENKTWYAGPGSDLEKLARFMPKAETVREKSSFDPQAEFASALKAAGLQVEGMPVMDGKMQRVPTVDDKPGQRNGAYVGYTDGKPSGFIQNFKTGLKENWTTQGMQLSPADMAQLQAQAALAKQQRAAEIAETQGNFEALPETTSTPNKYLERKGVEAHGVRFEGESVVVPMRDVDGKLWSIQRISPDAEAPKMFEKGGKKLGTMHVIGEVKPGSEILVAEGYATGASLHQATGKTVAVAFDSGNVGPVVNALQQRYSTSPIFIMADNDRPNANRGNVGVEKALEAAEKYKVGVAFPKFKDPLAKVSDFNDLHKSEGLSEVKRQVESAISKTLEQSHKEAKAMLPAKEIKEALPNGRYTGQVVGSTAYHAAQDIGGREGVVHPVAALNQAPMAGKIQTVQYQNGKGQVVDRTPTKQKELQR
ncbi:zincin-like metallopeptidase domain-containing protein [Limnobacter sp. MED105]|uniref:zincin-like metallopeptidase domain-containing protein n=1 Tax=Limnobacter sp. MED105 TaxID=391597 RepID=UPI000319B04A|nr:zincin-like metallopeptidase domain-containing protein [Limnobacter sp. MED105]